MTRKPKASVAAVAALLAAAVVSPAFASGFTYDLRFAPGSPGIVDNHDVSLVSTGGTYTLQLWGQIAGDTTYTNDGWVHGFVGVGSSQVSGGAFSAGGIVSGVVDTTIFDAASSINGAAASFTPDGIGDWGSIDTTNPNGWMLWQAAGGQPPGVLGGSVTAGFSQAVNANTWEILLATFTVNIGGSLGIGGSTHFDVLSGLSGTINTGTLTNAPALIACIDTAGGTNAQTQTAITSGGVNFNVPTVLNVFNGNTVNLAHADNFSATNIFAGGTLLLGNGGLLTGGIVTNNGLLTFTNTNAGIHTAPVVGAGTLTQAGTGTTTLTGLANYSGPTIVTTGVLDFGGGVSHNIAGVSGGGTLQVEAGTTLTSDGVKMPTGSLIVNGIQQIRSNGSNNGASKVSSLTIAGATNAWTGRIDLTNNLMVVEAASSGAKPALMTTLLNQVNTTASKGIISSTITTNTAVAVVDNATFTLAFPTNKTTMRGVALDSNSILVVQALKGDLNLDGKVDVQDLGVMVQHYHDLQSTRTWTTGNTTNAGNVQDLGGLIQNYNKTFGTFSVVSNISTGSSASPVPEPASVGILGLAGILLLRRKRKCRT